MPDPAEMLVFRAAEEAPRCPRCDRLMPENTCNCEYGIKPSPLRGKELVVETDDPEAARILRSLGARYAAAHGFFLRPSRVRVFEALWELEAVAIGNRRFRFPDGKTRDFYQSTHHIRHKLKRRVMA
jgi:hypothetical protein